MSKKLNITPGEVYTTVQDPAFLNFEIRLRGDDMRLVATMGIDCSPEEEAANATLYADAHNTYNKCQMLPSEILERAIMRDKYLTGYEEALRYANTRAVSIDQIVEVVKGWVTANDDTSTEEACEHVIADLRKRLEALMNTM